MSRWTKGLLIWGLLLASSTQAQTVEYIHTDALGSVVAVTDAAGNVIERREYEPYGHQLTPTVSNGPGYTGHVQDAATGLVYMQQRYYDAQIGRFLSVDPVTAHANPGLNFNRYWYANNNPYTFVDPDGRQSVLACANPANAAACAAAGIGTRVTSQQAAKAAVNAGGAAAVTTIVANEAANQAGNKSGTEAPGKLVGEQDSKSGAQGGRHNSGPLAPENGGTGDAAKDFEKLTGGQSGPAPEGSRYPAGTQVGENGIAIRPGTDKSGPRIDIPAQGDKPHETLHYPKERR